MFPVKRALGMIFVVFLMREVFSEESTVSVGIKERSYSSPIFSFKFPIGRGPRSGGRKNRVSPRRTRPDRELQVCRLARNAIAPGLSLIHISEPTRQAEISYAVFCL